MSLQNDIPRRLARPPYSGASTPAQREFGALAIAIVAGLVGLQTIAFPEAGWHGRVAAVALFAAYGFVAALCLPRSHPHVRIGAANGTTLARAGLAALLLTPLLAGAPVPGWTVSAIAAVVLGLDGIDGWLARRQRLVSDFGARFDMETDSAFALILAGLAATELGAWVLLLGLARYTFAAAAFVWPWLDARLPERAGRKAVCVLQLLVLIALQRHLLPPEVAAAIGLIAVAALLWSFGRDIAWLRANRA